MIGIECLEPLDNKIAVTDEHFIKWLSMKEHGRSMYCKHVTFTHGRPLRQKAINSKKEGRHELYDGKYDEETERFLEERADRKR